MLFEHKKQYGAVHVKQFIHKFDIDTITRQSYDFSGLVTQLCEPLL